MEHTWAKNHDTYCTACQTWLPKGECRGEPRSIQIVPKSDIDSTEEGRRMDAYERQFYGRDA